MKIPLTNFELFIMRNLIPLMPPYGEIKWLEVLHVFIESLSKEEKDEIGSQWKGVHEGNIISFLIDNGYIFRHEQTMIVRTLISDDLVIDNEVPDIPRLYLTRKGRSLRDELIYSKKNRDKIISIRVKFNYKRLISKLKLFLKKYA